MCTRQCGLYAWAGDSKAKTPFRATVWVAPVKGQHPAGVACLRQSAGALLLVGNAPGQGGPTREPAPSAACGAVPRGGSPTSSAR